MDLVLVRHAIAEERDGARWPDDALRPLTAAGRERFAAAARGLGGLIRPDRVLASPYARTWETAAILGTEAGWPAPEALPALEADAGLAAALAAVERLGADGTVALIGHEPTMTMLLDALVVDEDRPRVEPFRKGAAALVAFPGTPAARAGRLAFQHQPRALRALAAAQ
jgi:phosphohistidine phosphatase